MIYWFYLQAIGDALQFVARNLRNGQREPLRRRLIGNGKGFITNIFHSVLSQFKRISTIGRELLYNGAYFVWSMFSGAVSLGKRFLYYCAHFFWSLLRGFVTLWKKFHGGLFRLQRFIRGRAYILLFNYLNVRGQDRNEYEYFKSIALTKAFNPHLLVETIGMAIKQHSRSEALTLTNILMERAPESSSLHEQAGVKVFLSGEYDIAEKIWSRAADIREKLICERGLDKLKLRLLGPSWILAIGHIAHLDTYLKNIRLSGREDTRVFMVPPKILGIPNMALLECWKPYINFDSNSLPRLGNVDIDLLQDTFWYIRFGKKSAKMFSHAGAIIQQEWERRALPPLLSLTKEQCKMGARVLKAMRIPRDAWYVCVHVREQWFHKAWDKVHPSTRNANIESYMLAMEEIVKRGGFVIRMGDPSMKPLPTMKGVVDYAHSCHKSEAMDVFLCATARFFIGTNSGLGLVPPIFGVPCALTNWIPIGLPQWYPNDLFIPKLCYSKKLDRLLTFEEMFHSKIGWHQFVEYFENEMIQVIDNSPEEILDLVRDMLDRETKRIRQTAQDKMLSQSYNQIVINAGGYLGARIGPSFLRQHVDLLPTKLIKKIDQQSDLKFTTSWTPYLGASKSKRRSIRTRDKLRKRSRTPVKG